MAISSSPKPEHLATDFPPEAPENRPLGIELRKPSSPLYEESRFEANGLLKIRLESLLGDKKELRGELHDGGSVNVFREGSDIVVSVTRLFYPGYRFMGERQDIWLVTSDVKQALSKVFRDFSGSAPVDSEKLGFREITLADVIEQLENPPN